MLREATDSQLRRMLKEIDFELKRISNIYTNLKIYKKTLEKELWRKSNERQS